MKHSFYEPKELRGDWESVYYDGEVKNMEPSGDSWPISCAQRMA